jgi:hypothetical protein
MSNTVTPTMLPTYKQITDFSRMFFQQEEPLTEKQVLELTHIFFCQVTYINNISTPKEFEDALKSKFKISMK